MKILDLIFKKKSKPQTSILTVEERIARMHRELVMEAVDQLDHVLSQKPISKTEISIAVDTIKDHAKILNISDKLIDALENSIKKGDVTVIKQKVNDLRSKIDLQSPRKSDVEKLRPLHTKNPRENTETVEQKSPRQLNRNSKD